MDFDAERIAIPKTVRLVSTARLRQSVLRALAESEAQEADLAEIEGATSARLQTQERGINEIDPKELVHAVPCSAFINAAFSYPRSGELNRFNGEGRGAWYAAESTDICLAEVTFHLCRELERVNDFNAIVDYAELFASFAGLFVDLRKCKQKLDCLNSDPSIGYPAGNVLADTIRKKGHNGIVYPSLRYEGGTCIVALQPKAVQSVAQGDVLRVSWAGSRTPTIERNPTAQKA